MTLAKAAQRWLLDLEVADRSPRTLQWYRQKVGQLEAAWGQETPLEEIERGHLLDFIADLRRAGRSPAYVRGWYQIFRALFGWARTEGYGISPTLIRDGDRWFGLAKPSEVEAPITICSEEWQIRRRYYGADRISEDGMTLYNPAKMTVQRYRFRGALIGTPYNVEQVDPARARFRLTGHDDADFVGLVSELVSST